MPRTRIVFFCHSDGASPFLQWLDLLPEAIQNKCTAKLERLSEYGHELRRPEADLLRNGIYELRASRQGLHYRILYFYHQQIIVVWNGIAKESSIPEIHIERAIKAKELFFRNPLKHTYREPS